MVYKNHSKPKSTNNPTTIRLPATSSTPQNTTGAPKTTTYEFKELGISMDLAPDWEVTSTPTKDGTTNFYSWTVAKTGSDGIIQLASAGFRGGFEDCRMTPASVKEVVKTNNPKLLFMSWSYTQTDTVNSTGIVLADEANFKTTNKESADSVKNSALTPGNYYFCLGYPAPGFSLGLNTEPAPGYARRDSISALSANGKDPISPSAQSYSDIKTMLTSIK